MKSSAERIQDPPSRDAQQVSLPDPLDTQRAGAEWTSDCLHTLQSPVRFTRADWP